MSNSTAAAHFSINDFRVGDVLSRSFEVFFRNFLSFGSLSAVMNLPLLVYLLVDLPQESATGVFIDLSLMILITIALSSITLAVILYGTFQDMRGRRVSAFESFSKVASRALPVLLLSIMNAIVLSIGLMALVVPGLILMTVLFVTIPACVVERLGPVASWSRSAELTRGYRWRVFGLWLILMVADRVVEKVLSSATMMPDSVTLYALLSYAWAALFTGYQAVTTAVAYHNLRVMKEGVDIEQIAAVFD